MRIDITARHLDTIARGYLDLAERAEDLKPMGFRVRDRWLESERRLFARRPWEPKKPSTRRRYRYPIAHFASLGTIQHTGSPNSPTLYFSGTLQRTLTTRHAFGQRDSVLARQAGKTTRGGIDVRVGLRARGPVAYGNFHANRHGNRPARPPVNFDRQAHRDATGDTLEYLFGRHAGRRR